MSKSTPLARKSVSPASGSAPGRDFAVVMTQTTPASRTGCFSVYFDTRGPAGRAVVKQTPSPKPHKNLIFCRQHLILTFAEVAIEPGSRMLGSDRQDLLPRSFVTCCMGMP